MAQLITNNEMKRLLKTVYLDGVYNAKYQNSPVLSRIKKENWVGGDTIKYAAQVGNGGNFGSVYSTLVSNQTDGAKNAEWAMTQGYLTGFFNINQPEILTSASDRGAYMKILSNKMAATFDGLSKYLASYLYGGKYGILGTVTSVTGSGSSNAIGATGNTMVVPASTAIKLDIDSRFQIMSGSVPDASKIGTSVYTVTGIDGNTITFSATVPGETINAGDQIILYTAINSAGQPVGIEGLNEIIPTFANRTGSDWDTYIATTFREVDRSKLTDRLAGQFVLGSATGDTKKTDALVSLLKKTKRAGGLNNIMIVNDETWDAIGEELGIQKNIWQMAESGSPSKKQVSAGLSELGTAFGDAFINRVVIDPYCTENVVYSLEDSDLTFYDLGNVSRVINPVANDQLGKHTIESVGDQGFGDSFTPAINVDKLFQVAQGQPGPFGEEFRIACNIFGNFKLGKTASAGAAVLQ